MKAVMTQRQGLDFMVQITKTLLEMYFQNITYFHQSKSYSLKIYHFLPQIADAQSTALRWNDSTPFQKVN